MNTMMAIQVHPVTGQLVPRSMARPVPLIDEVLVRVRAAALEVGEHGQGPHRPTRLAAERSLDRSLEFAGTVAAFGGGDGEGRFVVGQEVFGLVDPARGCALAEYAVVSSVSLAGRPRTISFAEAAALPAASVVAWDAVTGHEESRPGQPVIVPDGSGEPGLYAVQIAAARGLRVAAIGAGARRALLYELGADPVILPDAHVPSTADLVFDHRTRSTAHREPTLTAIAGLVDRGCVRPLVDRIFPMGAAAYAFASASRTRGPGRTILVT
jgi:NADPH:quinone reductase-like Zn-dependent oxidoreductase